MRGEEKTIKNRPKSFPIRNQMVLMFFVVTLPLFAASIILIFNMRTEIKLLTIDKTVKNSDNIKYRITDIAESTDSVMKMLSVNSELKKFLAGDYDDESEYYSFYSKNIHIPYIRSSLQIKNIYFFVERSDFVFNSNYIYADDDIRAEKWYSTAADNPGQVVWDVIKSPTDENYYLGCAKAISEKGRVVGIAAAIISNEWIERLITDNYTKNVLAINGVVYYSDYEKISPGDSVSPDSDFLVEDICRSYDYGFWDFDGYTVLNNFSLGSTFQTVMLISEEYVSYSLNRLSVVYGGYCGLMVILSMLTIILFTSVFSRRIKLLSEKMHTVAGGNFNVVFDDKRHDEIADLYSDLSQMISSMRKMMNDVYETKLQNEAFRFNQMEAEFKTLASQINPHFLYNTLETIRMKAFCNNDKETADLVKKLGKFMRRCLEVKDGEVTLRSELEFTNSYLELQSARFGDRVSYSIYSEVSKDYMILPLIIQPVVENAFVHGIEGCKSNGRIDIKVYYSGSCVVADVTDNGSGITPERLAELEEKLRQNDTSSGKSIGLTNVNKRIKMYHGEQYGLSIKTELGKGTTIRITLPRNPVQKKISVQQ